MRDWLVMGLGIVGIVVGALSAFVIVVAFWAVVIGGFVGGIVLTAKYVISSFGN